MPDSFLRKLQAVTFAKFLRTPFLKNIPGRLLLDYLTSYESDCNLIAETLFILPENNKISCFQKFYTISCQKGSLGQSLSNPTIGKNVSHFVLCFFFLFLVADFAVVCLFFINVFVLYFFQIVFGNMVRFPGIN